MAKLNYIFLLFGNSNMSKSIYIWYFQFFAVPLQAELRFFVSALDALYKSCERKTLFLYIQFVAVICLTIGFYHNGDMDMF